MSISTTTFYMRFVDGLLSRLGPFEKVGADLVPNLKPGVRRDEDPQRSSDGTDPTVITGTDD